MGRRRPPGGPRGARVTLQEFRVDVPDAVLDDLRQRAERTRWPDLPDVGWQRGVPVAYLREVADHWAHRYDWRTWQTRLNEHPQLLTTLDGSRSTPCTSARPSRTRCRSSSPTAGRVPSSRCSTSSARSPTRAATAATRPTRSTSSCPRCPGWVLDAVARDRLGPRAHRTRVGGADDPPRLPALLCHGRRHRLDRLARAGQPRTRPRGRRPRPR